MTTAQRIGAHVVVSELEAADGGAEILEGAFRDRLGEVDAWPGFLGLEVWRDPRSQGSYLMVSWWSDEESFKAYMRSRAHERSHARIPGPPVKPRGVGVRRFDVVAR